MTRQHEEEDPDLQKLSQLVNEEIDSRAERTHGRLVRHKTGLLQARRRKAAGFQQRLYARWFEALDLYELALYLATRFGSKFNRTYRPFAAENQDFKFEALSKLHGSSCLVANEIYQLLLSGFASGAHARWRTLHEIALVTQFIDQQDPEVAEAFLLHRDVKAFQEARQYQKHSKKLGFRDADPAQLQELERRTLQLCQRFGASFKGDYGWAEAAIRKAEPSFKGGSVGIKHIERAVSSEHWNPLYQMANHAVHATSNSIRFNLGKMDEKDLILVGPSNAGLADPGHGALISLMRATSTLLSAATRMSSTANLNEDFESWSGTWAMMAELKVLAELVDGAGRAFLAADQKLKKEETEKHRSTSA